MGGALCGRCDGQEVDVQEVGMVHGALSLLEMIVYRYVGVCDKAQGYMGSGM